MVPLGDGLLGTVAHTCRHAQQHVGVDAAHAEGTGACSGHEDRVSLCAADDAQKGFTAHPTGNSHDEA